MKKIILTASLAFVVILGMNTKTTADPVVIGGPNTYPHMTGMCTCGKYPSCHPQPKPRFEENEDGNWIIWPPK